MIAPYSFPEERATPLPPAWLRAIASTLFFLLGMAGGFTVVGAVCTGLLILHQSGFFIPLRR
ncbi:MAG TPA: hypothetical protein VMU59_08630 [Caulobacteraceae bacterium]|nr:hypothetical protein [Caulobacteraceae bacterium]